LPADLRYTANVQRQFQVQFDKWGTGADSGNVAVVQLNGSLVVESFDFQQIPLRQKNNLLIGARIKR